MFELGTLAIIVLFAAIVLIAQGIKIVPQQHAWVLERLGRFHGVLQPGLNIVLPFIDRIAYRHSLKARLNPTTSVLTQVYEQVKANPKRVIFSEAEDEVVLRAAIQFRDFGYGEPVLVGRTTAVIDKLRELGIADPGSFEIHNSANSEHVDAMVPMLYERLQRRGFMERDVRRMVNQDRNVFASALLKLGVGDAMISGMTRPFAQTIKEVRHVLDAKEGHIPFGIHLMIGKNYTVFLADTTINERPTAEGLAHIATETAHVARRLGHEPRVAFLSFSTFGNPSGQWLDPIRGAVAILDNRAVFVAASSIDATEEMRKRLDEVLGAGPALPGAPAAP